MNDDALDPLIHVPTRLKIVATLAALPDGDTLSFTRLQDMIGLTPGNLIIHLRKLEEADYISSEKSRNGTVSVTTVALTGHGRKALGAYTQAAARPARRPVNEGTADHEHRPLRAAGSAEAWPGGPYRRHPRTCLCCRNCRC